MAESEELLPCPFSGKPVESSVREGRICVGCGSVDCPCHQVVFHSREEMLRRWNTRGNQAEGQEEHGAGEEQIPSSASRTVVDQRRMRVATLQLELVKCGKPRCRVCARGPAHGPYWYAYWKHDGRTRTQYVGKNLPESLTAYNEAPNGDGYIGQTFAVPRSYVTNCNRKPKKLHKTIKRRPKPSRKRPRN